MSIDTLLDIATLCEVEGDHVRARKLRAAHAEGVELREGKCRFNCTTKSAMWKLGGAYVWEHWEKLARPASVHLDQMYEQWRKENDRSDKL